MKSFGLLILVSVLVLSCNKETVDQPTVDEGIITDYIAQKNWSAKATGSGLYYVVNAPGTGDQPNAQSTVTVAYKGYFTDGGVFDESSPEGLTFSLQSVIQGWQEGIPLFKEGGEGHLLIPSALGYGSKDYAGIPGNSVLIFDVHLIDVK